MHVISRKVLKAFYERHARAKGPLTAWFHEAKNAKWRTPNEIKQQYRTADFLPGNRVVFNIGGNAFRLIVKIAYEPGIVYVRFVGTHAEYDKIDAENV